jgi:hypothetical protein
MSATKVVTGKVRFSYANVWEPKVPMGGGAAKYSVSLLIPKSDKKTVKAITDAIEAAKQEGKTKWGGKIPAKMHTPLRDGDEERGDDPVYAGHYFINATSKTQPGIVDRKVQKIIVQSEFYSGCYGSASINFYPFDTNGNRGIACGLNNLQKLEDGEPLGGATRAEDDFKPAADDDDDLL